MDSFIKCRWYRCINLSPASSRYSTLYENSEHVTVRRFSNSPLSMTKMPIKNKESFELLNGLQGRKKHDAINARRIAILAIVILGLGIVIPLFPDIKRYLIIRSMQRGYRRYIPTGRLHMLQRKEQDYDRMDCTIYHSPCAHCSWIDWLSASTS